MTPSIQIVRQFKSALLAELAAVSLAFAATEVLTVWILRSLFMQFLGRTSKITHFVRLLAQALGGSPDADLLLPMLIGCLIFIIAKNVALGATWRVILRQVACEQANFASRLYEHYLRAPYLSHIERSRSALQHNLNVASTQILMQVVFPLLLAASEACVILAIFAFLVVLAPLVTALLAAALCSALWLLRNRFKHYSRAASSGRRRTAKQLLQLTHDSLADIKSIKILAREGFFANLFRGTAQTHANFISADRLMQQIPRLVLEPIVIASLLVFYLALTAQQADQQIVLADLTLYAAASVRLLPAAQRMASQIQILMSSHADIDALVKDLSGACENLPAKTSFFCATPFRTSIEFGKVTFQYNNGGVVLADVTLTIRRGDKIAIFGATGSGKTTFLNLFLGLLQPTSGQVLIDGIPASPLAIFRQAAVAYVAQDTLLFDGTVLENIAFGAPTEDADQAGIWSALERVHLDKKVRALSDGLRSFVGSNGVALSGGERQRIALARALYQQPSLIVLDEATSQLDAETEAKILDDLISDSPDLTVIAVTHRLSTLGRFCRWLEFADGKLSEKADIWRTAITETAPAPNATS